IGGSVAIEIANHETIAIRKRWVMLWGREGLGERGSDQSESKRGRPQKIARRQHHVNSLRVMRRRRMQRVLDCSPFESGCLAAETGVCQKASQSQNRLMLEPFTVATSHP